MQISGSLVASVLKLAPYSGVLGFLVGIPTTIGTYFQVLRTRREAKEAREGLVYSANCLEFIQDDGGFVNLVPLETLHTLPKAGDIVLLPGHSGSGGPLYAAYRVLRVEHIYARVESKAAAPGQARLAKSVAHVELLSGTCTPAELDRESVAD